MAENKREQFTSRWAVYAVALGVAIGTGNIWRFPRIMAQNGGGAFIIAIVVCLVLWAIPVMTIEMSLGRSSRKGTIGAFGLVAGAKFTWMGAFVGWCTTCIMFYYSVVTMWCLHYVLAAGLGKLSAGSGFSYWNDFNHSYGLKVFLLLVLAVLCFWILFKGIVRGIERLNTVLVPGLLVILIIGMVRSVTLPGAFEGIAFVFVPQWEQLLHYRIWLEAVTQAAWSTGAGWGLLLTYGAYMHSRENVSRASVVTCFGDLFASILAGLVIIPAVFALRSGDAVSLVQESGPASTGLTFVWIPELYRQIPGGRIFLILFFIALTSAALTSLIAMMEMAAKNLIDLGWSRRRSLAVVCSGAFVFGLPSVFSLEFLANQDWVWGIGLLLSGMFMVIAAVKYDIAAFREKLIMFRGTRRKLHRIFDMWVGRGIPFLFTIVIFWWFLQAILVFEREAWWNPLGIYSVGTCLVQWGLVIGVLLLLNKKINSLIAPYRPDPE